ELRLAELRLAQLELRLGELRLAELELRLAEPALPRATRSSPRSRAGRAIAGPRRLLGRRGLRAPQEPTSPLARILSQLAGMPREQLTGLLSQLAALPREQLIDFMIQWLRSALP